MRHGGTMLSQCAHSAVIWGSSFFSSAPLSARYSAYYSPHLCLRVAPHLISPNFNTVLATHHVPCADYTKYA